MDKTSEAEPHIDAPTEPKQLDVSRLTTKARRGPILALAVFALGVDAAAAVYSMAPSDFALPDVSVAHAPSGRKAWQLIQNERYSAIITDLHMPHMDGFELIERVRAAARLAYVPIIVVSGDSDPDTPERVRRLGADAYFAKPYSPAAVRETLERLLHETSSPSP